MERLANHGPEAQSAPAVLMVRPAHFGFNSETAASNAFQHPPDAFAAADLQSAALAEFDALAHALARAGVEVIVAADSAVPVKPDAIFPNNWVSFHRDGTAVLYPMLAQNRRSERREEVLAQVIRDGSFRIKRTVDLSYRETQGQYLEGTGSLVLDRPSRIAYASLSPRTDLDVLGEFAQQLDYELVTFESIDAGGAPVYHTNVVLAIGSGFAVVCGDAIAAPAHRDALISKLRAGDRAIVLISVPQMRQFAGNLLELASARGPLIAVSATAWKALDPAQRRVLKSHGEIVTAAIPTIERIGGGGVRCMLAEIFLPKRDGLPTPNLMS
jgi:hypothetical protein